MLLDQSQSEKDQIIDWLVQAFASRSSKKANDPDEQLNRRKAGLKKIQEHAHLEGGLYEVHLLTIVKTLNAPNEKGENDHDWLRNKLTSLVDESIANPAIKAERRNQILAIVDQIPELLQGGDGVKILYMSCI